VKTGQILLAGGKIDLALERSDKAFALDKNNVGALNLRAAIKLNLNDAAGAIEYANLALAKQADNQDAYLVLATERLAAKDDLKAIEYFDKILAKDEKNIAVQLLKIKTLENLSKLTEAEVAYKKLLNSQIDSRFIRKTYAQFLVKHGRKDEAEQQLRTIATAQKDIQATLDVVRFLIATKGILAGRTELETLVKTDPKNYELAFALVSLYKAQKDTDQETSLLNQISHNAGDTSDGFKARGLIAYNLIQQGKKEDASRLLNAILEADKANGQALTIRAALAVDAKNYTTAISDLRTVLRDTPEASGAALMLASAYESSGASELAEEQYVKAFVSSKFSDRYGLPYVQFLLRNKKSERAEKLTQTIQMY
jgi:cellulose synthase operon protein C